MIRWAVGTAAGWALAVSAWGVHLTMFPAFLAYAVLVAASVRAFDAYVQTMIETWSERQREAELDRLACSTA